MPQHEINQGDSYEVRTQELLLTHMSTHSFWAFERIELTEEGWFKYTAINIMNEDQIIFRKVSPTKTSTENDRLVKK